MKTIILFLGLCFSVQGFASSDKALTISTEYTTLKSWIQQITPDGIIGGLYPYIQMDGYKVLFSKEFDTDHEIIRVFLAGHDGEKDFSITYIKSQHFQKDKTILRRFIGPEPTGWRMDEMNFETQKYIGRQGALKPSLSSQALAIINELGISLF